MYMIAYEFLDKLLSERDEKNLCQREELGQRHPVRHCPGGGLGQIREKNELPRIKIKFCRYDIDHERE
jgi:hypothetical protein